MLSSILLCRLSPYVDKIIGDHECRFRHNKSTINQIFFNSSNTAGKKWEENETVHLIFIDFKETYDSGRTEVLYYILNAFNIPMKQVRLIIMCLNETFRKVRIVKHV
jgi:hypothetical protein